MIGGLKLLLFLTLFWQTRFSLGQEVHHIDYAIPFIYLSDFLLIANLVLFLPRLKKHFRQFSRWSLKFLLPWFFFILWCLIPLFSGVLVSSAGWYRWFKVVEMFLAVFLLSGWLFTQEETVSSLLRRLWQGLFPLCILAILEFIVQESLGLQLIGEWQFNKLTAGISTFSWQGEVWLRPYASFPHPNVLGGILSVFLPVWRLVRRPQVENFNRQKVAFESSWFVGLVTLVLTFSRLAWINFLILSFIIFWQDRQKKEINRRFFFWSFVLIILLIISPNPFRERFVSLLSTDCLSFIRRWDLVQFAFNLLRKYPWQGVGLNQVVFWLEQEGNLSGGVSWVQPIHCVLIQVLTETGLIGLILWLTPFIIFLFWLRKNYLRGGFRSIVLPAIMIIGLFILNLGDHYLWTLQAGWLFSVLIIAICLSYTITPPPRTTDRS